jgi:hypothetical protein
MHRSAVLAVDESFDALALAVCCARPALSCCQLCKQGIYTFTKSRKQ